MEKFERLNRKELFGLGQNAELKQSDGNGWLYIGVAAALLVVTMIVYNLYKNKMELRRFSTDDNKNDN